VANSVLAGGISPLGACGGSPLEAGTTARKKEKFAAALWEMVGQSRTRRAHKTVVDRPPGLSRFSAFFLDTISPKLLQLFKVDTDRWAHQLWKLSRFSLAFPGSCWSFGISQSNGALLVGVAENFQPGFDVSGNEAPVFLTRVPGCPHAPPTSSRMDGSQSSTLRHRFHR